MRDKFHALLGIESGEKSAALMFLAQSVFLGIFLGAYDITAHSLLLSTFDEKVMARGYVVSGITGFLLLYLFSVIKERLQFKNFAVINLSVVAILTFLLWSALILSTVKWVIFIVFIMLGPLNIITILGSCATADRLFSHGPGQKLKWFGDTGIMTGIIIISIMIPVLLFLKFQLNNILLVSALSVLTTTIIQVQIGKKFSLVNIQEIQIPDKYKNKESVFTVFREVPYVRMISIFMFLSVLAFSFVQYSFMAVTKQQYPVAESMAVFLGFFTAGIMILILIFKQFIFKYVLHNYGLQICLIISPILVGFFTVLAIASGLLKGFTPESTVGFIIFFFFIAITRLVSKSLSDTVESPSLNVIYQSVDRQIKFKLHSVLIGRLNETMIMLSGLILTIIGLLSFVKLIHFSLVLLIICSAWLFVALKLFVEYRKSIKEATEKVAQEESMDTVSEKHYIFRNRFSASIDFKRDYFNLISGDYSVLSTNSNKRYFEKLIDFANTNEDINLLPALKKITVILSIDEGTRRRAAEVAELLQKYSASFTPDNEKLDNVKKLLAGARMPQTTEILKLLRDNSVESKRLAIYMIGKFRITDLLRDVCECLGISGLTTDAYEILKSFGPDAENELMRFYIVTSGNIMFSRLILRLLGKSNTKDVEGFLFQRLWSNSRQQKEISIKCLINCKFKPSDEEKQHLDQLTSDIIGFITWDLSAKIALERANDTFLLKKINREIDRWNKFLFDVLSITYNTGTINRIREYSESKTMESINYAFEMTDIVVSEAIKPKLITLLDFIPDEDRLNNLFQFFPGEIPAYNKLLEEIINRDYNLISLWTKACTLRSIEKIDNNDMAESVTALLFSPEEIIQEEAANLIARSNPDIYISASPRIADSIKKRLDNIINGTTFKTDLLFEKVQFLAKYFEGIPEDELLPLAAEMKYIHDFDAESLSSSGGCVIWPLFSENEVYIFNNRLIENYKTKYQNANSNDVYILPLVAVEEYHFQYADKSFEILKYIDSHEE
jgi:ATP:ADP antiporter, AAA family